MWPVLGTMHHYNSTMFGNWYWREKEKKNAQTQFSVALKFISSLPEYHFSNDKKHEFVLRNFRFAFNAGIKTN